MSSRAEFEAEALIYSCNKGASRWYKSTDCIWASSTDIRGKVTLSEQYDELETFFITTLGVKKLTLRMVYDQLVNKDLKADVSEIKSMIWALNSMIQAEGSFYQDPAQILASSIFPVAYPSGSIELRTASTEFAVNDRQPLTDLFQDQITLLDFNLEESRRLRPFLEWTGLTDRYLSVSVRELTSISGDDARPTASRKYDLKRKAHGLLRLVSHKPDRLTRLTELEQNRRNIQQCQMPRRPERSVRTSPDDRSDGNGPCFHLSASVSRGKNDRSAQGRKWPSH